MHVSPRSHLTAGIAALGAGALALAPIQPIPSTGTIAPQRVVENLAVELAASSIDPITPWVTTFETAGANLATLVEFYLEKPFPILQTIGANIATYIEELGNGQGGLIPEQIWNNVVTFFEAPWSPGAQTTFPTPPGSTTDLANGEYISKTDTGVVLGFPDSPSGSYNLLLNLIVGQAFTDECLVDGDCQLAQSAGILNFLNTNYSGQLLGLLGPLLAPVAVLTRSFTAIGEFFEAGDVIGAINELINIPANLTNGVLNGAGFIDLTAIVTQFVQLPVDTIGLELGGLLNSAPANGSLIDPDNPPTEFSVGVGFDGVTAIADPGFGSPVVLKGLPNGWLGSVIGLGQFVSEQMLVTPPLEAPAAANVAGPEAAAPALPEAPAQPESPAEEAAVEADPVVVDAPAPVVAEVVDDPAPVVDGAAAEDTTPVSDETLADLVSDEPDVDAPVEAAAVTEDAAPAPAAAVGSDDDGDSGSRASDSRRGARGTD